MMSATSEGKWIMIMEVGYKGCQKGEGFQNCLI